MIPLYANWHERKADQIRFSCSLILFTMEERSVSAYPFVDLMRLLTALLLFVYCLQATCFSLLPDRLAGNMKFSESCFSDMSCSGKLKSIYQTDLQQFPARVFSLSMHVCLFWFSLLQHITFLRGNPPAATATSTRTAFRAKAGNQINERWTNVHISTVSSRNQNFGHPENAPKRARAQLYPLECK